MKRMPSFDVTLNLPGFSIGKSSGFNPIIYDLASHLSFESSLNNLPGHACSFSFDLTNVSLK